MTRFAKQRVGAFSFDNFVTENEADSAYNFLCYNTKQIFMVCTLKDHRNDAINETWQ